MVSSTGFRTSAAFSIALVGSMTGTAFASAAPAATSEKALTAELLGSKDLPAGWQAYPSAGFDSGLPACLETVYHRAPGQQRAVERTFSGPGGQASFQDRLVSFGRRGAEVRTASLERSVASCTTSANGPVLGVKAIRFPAIGQQSRAFLVTLGRRDTSRVYGVIVLAREGDTVVVATHGSVSSSTTQATRLAARAIRKAA
jgi:hypothetical protein